jgi:hypothetical protein
MTVLLFDQNKIIHFVNFQSCLIPFFMQTNLKNRTEGADVVFWFSAVDPFIKCVNVYKDYYNCLLLTSYSVFKQ